MKHMFSADSPFYIKSADRVVYIQIISQAQKIKVCKCKYASVAFSKKLGNR